MLTYNIIEFIVPLLSTIISIIAVIIAVRNRKLNEFSAINIASAQVKPLIGFNFHLYKSYVQLELKNYGMGTAIIDHVYIQHGDQQLDSISRVAKKGDATRYQYQSFMNRGDIYLPKGEAINLIDIAGGTELKKRASEINSVSIEVSYKDLFGERQPSAVRSSTQ